MSQPNPNMNIKQCSYEFESSDLNDEPPQHDIDVYFKELKESCKYPELLTHTAPEYSGHGQGLGDLSDLGGTNYWAVVIEMHIDDFKALKEKFGLYDPEGDN